MFRYYDDFREYFYCNYMWTAEKLKSSLKKIKSPTAESELFQTDLRGQCEKVDKYFRDFLCVFVQIVLLLGERRYF